MNITKVAFRIIFWLALPLRLIMLTLLFVIMLAFEGKNVVNWKAGLLHGLDKGIRD